MQINDEERRQWIDNDERLYTMWKVSKMKKRDFIKENREMIDRVIRNVIEGKKPAHYLRYGG